MIFEYLRKRALIAGVAAELKAQSKDQELVRDVCFTTAGMLTINQLATERFPEKGKLRYFMITTFLLADTLTQSNVRLDVKAKCWEYLCQRQGKITRHMDMPEGVVIKQSDVDDLEELSELGLMVFHDDRRQQLLGEISSRTGMNF